MLPAIRQEVDVVWSVWRMKVERINLSPSPSALLESLRSIGYTLETALADIVDNSISANATHVSVRFLWNAGNPWVAVADDGCGMTSSCLIEAMRFGSAHPHQERGPGDLGRFGLGMKTASLSQARRMTVISKRALEVSACEWNIDKISDDAATGWDVLFLDEASMREDALVSELLDTVLLLQENGTIVLWRNLDSSLFDESARKHENRFSRCMDSARGHLELVFHRYLSPDSGYSRVNMDFNNSRLEAFDPFGTSVPARQELPVETILVQDNRVTIQPYILPHYSKAASRADYERLAGEQGYTQNQGFYVYRSRRLILNATWFRLIPKTELNKLIRIRVDIPTALDHLWRIDIKKSQANPPEQVRSKLKQIIDKIAGSGKRVFTHRAARIHTKGVPIWIREVIDARVRYSVNQNHPLISSVLANLSSEWSERLVSSIKLIDGSFPYDMFYADAANDQTEFAEAFADEEQLRQIALQLVEAFRECGYSDSDIRERLAMTEPTSSRPDIISSLLDAENADARLD